MIYYNEKLWMEWGQNNPHWKQENKKKKNRKNERGVYAFTFHQNALGCEIAYCSKQIYWKDMTLLKHWKSQGVYFKCQWLNLFTFSKTRVPIDCIIKSKYSEQTLQ